VVLILFGSGVTPGLTTQGILAAMSDRKTSTQCKVCNHPDRWRLELLRAGGASLGSLAKKFNVSIDSVFRHWRDHVSDEAKASYLVGPADLARLAEKAAVEGDSVLDYLKLCRTVLTAQLAVMSESNDARGAAFVAGQLTRTLETIAKVTGEIGDLARSVTINNTTNVAVLQEHPKFLQAQATLLRALGPFPDARAAVVAALRELDGSPPAATPAPANGKLLELEAAHVAQEHCRCIG
jgi:hypothetical protein